MNKCAVLSGVMTLLLTAPVYALDGDTFRPFVSFSQYYDDNLFRLADKESITLEGDVAVGPQAALYSVLNFGANVDWRIKRQQVLARFAKNLVRYSDFDSLNYDGYDYLAQWNWQLGDHLSGRIGATESLTQSSFTDLNTNTALNNQRTVSKMFVTANWQFHPRWQVGGALSDVKGINSDSTQLSNDFTERAQELNLTWRTPKGTSISTQFRLADAEYPNRQLGILDNSYSQQELNVSTIWPYSGLLRFQGRLGYLMREHETVSERDFSGFTGRATTDYFPTGKTVLSLSLYRELSAASEISNSYRLATGVSLNGAWTITSKLKLRGSLSDETAEFKGDPRFFLFNLPVRVDQTQAASLSLDYEPVRSAVIGIGLQTGRRESNNVINDSDYNFNTVFANVRVDF